MSTDQLNEILKIAESLTPDEKLLLAQRLLEQAKQTESSSDENSITAIDSELRARWLNQQTKWIKQHQAQYAGRYVVLDEKQFVADAPTYREATEAARRAGLQRPFITYVPDPNITYFAGW